MITFETNQSCQELEASKLSSQLRILAFLSRIVMCEHRDMGEIFGLSPCGSLREFPNIERADPKTKPAWYERSGPEGGPFACRSNRRSCYAYIRFCSPLPFNRRLRPDVLHARPTRWRGRLGAQLSALQYRAERRKCLSHLGRSRRLHRR